MVYSFPPEKSPGRLEFELASYFRDMGHFVHVVTAFPRRYFLEYRIAHLGNLIYNEIHNGVKITRVGPEFGKNTLIFRKLEYMADFFIFMLGGSLSNNVDIILATSPPLTIALAASLLAKIRRVPLIVRVCDIHPDAIVDLGLIRNRLLIRVFNIIEKIVYNFADSIIVLSESYRQNLIRKNVPPYKVRVIPNWVDLHEVDATSEGQFRYKYNISNKFVVTYAGNMSWFQDLETIIEAASLISYRDDILFLLVGSGPQKEMLKKKVKQLNVQNITFLPLQTREKYLQIIKASDVCLVGLKKEFRSPAVPSKLLDILACGTSVIVHMPDDGDAPKIVQSAKCGLVIPPQDPKKLADAILYLADNTRKRQEMGKNGRLYLEKNFSLHNCAGRYLNIMFALRAERK
jgi:colanic acid biosynthesis glycosyl transferase WcaI